MEDDNNRLLETIAKLEDENNALNDFVNEFHQEAMSKVCIITFMYQCQMKIDAFYFNNALFCISDAFYFNNALFCISAAEPTSSA